MKLEPIAIVGMGCRFGSAGSLDELWRVLLEGRCILTEIPPDRFSLERYYDAHPGTRGRIVTRQGAFLEDLRGFDASLFRLSHREASAMDPQQRHLLEVAYQALQDAGLPFEQVDGVRAGVYVGLFTADYRERILKHPDFDLDVYSEIGSTRSSAAGRISYAFNLTGPAVAVDAACASSLTAVHLACQALWSGELPLALAGGCNVVLEPETTICFSRSKMLSPSSRCRFGDARAEGFVRSEGMGMVVLKPLSRALADQDRIYALIRATGANNDARQGGGLFMTPSREGQMALLRRLYLESGLPLEQLAFMEAHGTGTRAGDPVECNAIAEVIGKRRPGETPLYLGSIKTNIGHTEGAAGIASLIKVALSLHHRILPPSLHFENPNPDIHWEEGRLAIPTSPVMLPQQGPVFGGVSSFGLSGTNAHAILEGWEREPHAHAHAHGSTHGREQAGPGAPNAAPVYFLPLSAHVPKALREQVVQMRTLLSRADCPPLADVCFTAAQRRSHLAHRVAVVGSSTAELVEALTPFLDQSTSETARETPRETPACRTVFVFPGQGGQWVGMGRALMSEEPSFREELEALEPHFVGQEGWSLLEALQDPAGKWSQDITKLQPVLFAVQVGLAALWQAYGITPQAVVGHSMGEVAAALVAGVLTRAEAVQVICTRSRLLGQIRGQGRMLVVGLGPSGAGRVIEGYEDRVAIAASNARSSTVLSGDPQTLDQLQQELTEQGIYCNRVDVDVASHSPQVEPLLAPLREALAQLQPQPGRLPFYSTVEATVRPGVSLDAVYWAANLRCAVRFAETSRVLLREGFDTFLELGPHPVLINPLQQTIQEEHVSAIAVPSARREDHSRRSLLNAATTLYLRGFELRGDALQKQGRCVSLPSYPFQHEPFWFVEHEQREELQAQPVLGARRTRRGTRAHPFLPHFFQPGSSVGTWVWEVPLSTRLFPYLEEHKVRGAALLPGAAFAEMAMAAARERFGDRAAIVEGLELRDYFVVPTQAEKLLQVELRTLGDDQAAVYFYSFEEEEGTAPRTTRLHARTQVRVGAPTHEHIHHDGVELSAEEVPSPVEGRALMLEELTQLMLRRERQPRQGGALMSVTVAGMSHLPGGLKGLLSRLRGLVRQGDLVQALGPQQVGFLLRKIQSEEQLLPVVRRVGLLLRELVGEPAGETQADGLAPFWMVGQVLPAEALDPQGLLEGCLQGALPPLPEPEGLVSSPAESSWVGGTQAVQALYASMNKRSIDYGPIFRPLRQLERRGDKVRAILSLPEGVSTDGYQTHPALMDGVFQAAVGSFLEELGLEHPRTGTETFLPVGIRRLAWHRVPHGTLFCHAWRRSDGQAPDTLEVDFIVTDEHRQLCLEAEGLRVRMLEARTTLESSPGDAWVYQWQWERLPDETGVSPLSGRSFVLVGAGTPGERLAQQLRQEQATVSVVQRLSETLKALEAQPLSEVLVLAPTVEGKSANSQERSVRETGTRDPHGALELAIEQSWEVLEFLRTLGARLAGRGVGAQKVWLITPSVESGGATPSTLASSALWGLARVIQNEVPELALRLVSLEAGRDPELLEALRRGSEEDELRVEAQVSVHRLVKTPTSSLPVLRRLRALGTEEPFMLSPGGQGITLEPAERRAPEPTQVEVQIEAAALDPAHALGLVGLAGTIQAVGESTPGLQVGQQILSGYPVGSGALARFVRLSSASVVTRPAELSTSQAARLAQVWLPAQLALQQIGGIQPDERVLIVGGEHPVGAALAWLAQQAGAQVIVAAQERLARERLRDQGLVCVTRGRTPTLIEHVLELTHHQGAELVLEVVAGDPLQGALELLTPGGRWARVSAEPVTSGLASEGGQVVTWAHVVLPTLVQRRPERVGQALKTLLGMKLPLTEPHPAMPLSTLVKLGGLTALNGRVLRLENDALTLEEPLQAGQLFRKTGSYVLSGGTGGLGLQVAAWMAERGAGHLILLSRSGRQAGLDAALQGLERLGAEVTVLPVDVSSRLQLESALTRALMGKPPLKGIFHLAGVLDDGTLEQQSREKLRRVMGPKVAGAWQLDRVSRAHTLEHFVLFSSAASTLGSPGQANYAAANAWLDGLAAMRRAEGLPGLSLRWGVWAEVGLAAAQENRAGRLEARGLLPMNPMEALRALEEVLLHQTGPSADVMGIDWSRWAATFPRFTRSPKVAGLVPSSQSQVQEVPLKTLLESLSPAEKQARVLEYLRVQVADVLRMPIARLRVGVSLAELGLDSLMTVELRSRLADTLQLELSPAQILRMPHLQGLAQLVLERLLPHEQQMVAPLETGQTKTGLDPEIRAQGPTQVEEEPKAVLLTGATGFLGAHLLRELLDRTSALVYCLVRAESIEQANIRIQETLAFYELARLEDGARIVPVLGQLEAVRLGLEPGAFRALADQVDAIYHCAAWVNHLLPYERLEAANVGGTREMLRLASVGRPLPLHHVSTLAVFNFTQVDEHTQLFQEDTPLPTVPEPFFAGYAQSKWMAEKLIEEARTRGLAVNVYRAGAITGSTHAGICPETDAIWRVVQGVVQSGMLPQVSRGIGLTPVDLVARSILSLSRRQETLNQNFHVFDPKPFPLASVAYALKELGYALKPVPIIDWLGRLGESLPRDSSMWPILGQLQTLPLEKMARMRIVSDCRKTLAWLERREMASMRVTPKLLKRYLERLIRSGFLPAPRRTSSETALRA